MMARYTKIMRRTMQATLLAGTLAVGCAAFVPAASARSQVPFRASVSEQFHVLDQCPPPFTSVGLGCAQTDPGTGVGLATLMGRVTQPQHLTAVTGFAANGCATELKLVTLAAANGDQVLTYLQGTACGDGTGDGTYQVTGGTGRFSGASGGGTYRETYTFDPITGTGADATLRTGTIASPGSSN